MQAVYDILGRPEVLLIGGCVAGFLLLTWIVRGVPLGRATRPEPGDAPSAGRRDLAVAMAVSGFLTILVGAFAAFRYGIPWSLPVFALGIALTLGGQRRSRPYRHVSPTMRRVAAFSDAALTTSLVGGILLVANVAAFRYGGRPLDFTRDEAFTLSSLSLREARTLPKPLKITMVMGQDPRSGRQRARVRQLVQLYREANPGMVATEELHPYRQAHAAEFAALVKRAPDLNVVGGDAIVLEYGAESGPVERSVISASDLARVAAGGKALSFTAEDAITSTLVRFREGRRSPIGFITGHGEPSIGEMDPRLPGLGLWKIRLASLGLDAVELNLTREDVPPAVGVAVIVGPKSRYGDAELARLKAFLVRGGTLLVAMPREDVALGDFLGHLNVAFDPGTIVDPRLNAGYPTEVLTEPLGRSDHPLVSALTGQYFLVPAASPLRIIGRATGPDAPRVSPNPAMLAYPVLQTSRTSRAVVNRTQEGLVPDASDRPGPHIVGLAISERAEVAGGGKVRPRAVVLSSAMMATNPFFPQDSDLLMNAVQWLRGKSEESGGVAPRVQEPLVFTADPNLRVRLHLVPTILAVVLIVGIGATTYLARRS